MSGKLNPNLLTCPYPSSYSLPPHSLAGSSWVLLSGSGPTPVCGLEIGMGCSLLTEKRKPEVTPYKDIFKQFLRVKY